MNNKRQPNRGAKPTSPIPPATAATAEYESELVFLKRQVEQSEAQAAQDDLEGDFAERLQEAIARKRQRIAALEAKPPTLPETLAWLRENEESLIDSHEEAIHGPDADRAMAHYALERLGIVRARIAELDPVKKPHELADGQCYAASAFIREIRSVGDGEVYYQSSRQSDGASNGTGKCSVGHFQRWIERLATKREIARLHISQSDPEVQMRQMMADQFRQYARLSLSNPDIISDEMLLAEVERRGLKPSPKPQQQGESQSRQN